MKALFAIFLAIFFISCGGAQDNPLGSAFGAANDADPLKIGADPVMSAKQKQEAARFSTAKTHRCLHTPIGDIRVDFHKVFSIYQAKCVRANNFNQQWYIIAPPLVTTPLAVID